MDTNAYLGVVGNKLVGTKPLIGKFANILSFPIQDVMSSSSHSPAKPPDTKVCGKALLLRKLKTCERTVNATQAHWKPTMSSVLRSSMSYGAIMAT